MPEVAAGRADDVRVLRRRSARGRRSAARSATPTTSRTRRAWSCSATACGCGASAATAASSAARRRSTARATRSSASCRRVSRRSTSPTRRCGGRCGCAASIPSRNTAIFHTFGRLRAGVTIDQARARLATLAKQLAAGASRVRRRQGHQPVPLQEQRVGEHEAVAADAAGRGRLRAADRLRQHRQPAALARVRTHAARSRCGARSAPIGCASSVSC